MRTLISSGLAAGALVVASVAGATPATAADGDSDHTPSRSSAIDGPLIDGPLIDGGLVNLFLGNYKNER